MNRERAPKAREAISRLRGRAEKTFPNTYGRVKDGGTRLANSPIAERVVSTINSLPKTSSEAKARVRVRLTPLKVEARAKASEARARVVEKSLNTGLLKNGEVRDGKLDIKAISKRAVANGVSVLDRALEPRQTAKRGNNAALERVAPVVVDIASAPSLRGRPDAARPLEDEVREATGTDGTLIEMKPNGTPADITVPRVEDIQETSDGDKVNDGRSKKIRVKKGNRASSKASRQAAVAGNVNDESLQEGSAPDKDRVATALLAASGASITAGWLLSTISPAAAASAESSAPAVAPVVSRRVSADAPVPSNGSSSTGRILVPAAEVREVRQVANSEPAPVATRSEPEAAAPVVSKSVAATSAESVAPAASGSEPSSSTPVEVQGQGEPVAPPADAPQADAPPATDEPSTDTGHDYYPPTTDITCPPTTLPPTTLPPTTLPPTTLPPTTLPPTTSTSVVSPTTRPAPDTTKPTVPEAVSPPASPTRAPAPETEVVTFVRVASTPEETHATLSQAKPVNTLAFTGTPMTQDFVSGAFLSVGLGLGMVGAARKRGRRNGPGRLRNGLGAYLADKG